MNLDDLLEEFKDENVNGSPDGHRENRIFKDSMWGSVSFIKDNND